MGRGFESLRRYHLIILESKALVAFHRKCLLLYQPPMPIDLPRRWESPLILLAALLWLPGAGGNSFLSDDIGHLLLWGTPPFAQIWKWFYTQDFNYYRPLTALLWKLNYALWGLEVIGYQLVNFVLHTGCALLVRHLALQIFPGLERIGLVAALIFLFQPGHIFGILMISALTGLLCTLFYLATVVAYLQGRNGRPMEKFLSLACFVLALLTKELALSLPLLICAWEAIRLRAESRFNWRSWVVAWVPYGLVAALYLLFRHIVFGQMPSSPLHEHVTPLRLLVNLATYLAKCFAPWGLEDLKPLLRGQPLLLAAISAAGLSLGAGILWHWRRTLVSGHLFGLIFFTVSVLPVITLYSPWNTYLPSAGIALMLGTALSWSRGGFRRGALIVFLTLSVSYSLDHQRNWRRGRDLCGEVADAVARLEATGPIYLANLPAEWNEVPLFVSDWALKSTLMLQHRSRDISALANVVKAQRQEQLETTVLGPGRFALRLTDPGDFFRLDRMEILSGARPLDVGYAYERSGIGIRVTGLSPQHQANALEIDMGSSDKLARVYLWNGVALEPLLKP